MKKKTVIIILAILVLLTLIFIFGNSLKNREASKQDSDFLVQLVEPLVEKIFGRKIENLGLIVRKTAHLIEFCLLGLGVAGLICKAEENNRKPYFGYGFFGVLAVAVVDEFIQSFSDRGSAVGDVLIDFCGALIGFGIVLLVLQIIKRRKQSNK